MLGEAWGASARWLEKVSVRRGQISRRDLKVVKNQPCRITGQSIQTKVATHAKDLRQKLLRLRLRKRPVWVEQSG